jgi:hypothetical protein
LLHLLGKKALDRIGLAEEKLESLLEEISIYCFQLELDKKEFLSKTYEILQRACKLDVPISDALVKTSQNAT